MTVMTVGGIAGPLVAGALTPVLGLQWLYLVDAVYLRTQPVLLMSFVVDIIAMVFGMPRASGRRSADQSRSGTPQTIDMASRP